MRDAQLGRRFGLSLAIATMIVGAVAAQRSADPGSTSDAKPPERTTVRVRVFDESRQRVVANARVRLQPRVLTVRYRDRRTSSDGVAVFSVPPGTYDVAVQPKPGPDGYVPVFGTPLGVNAASDIEVHYRVFVGYSVTGIVFASDGTPCAGAGVGANTPQWVSTETGPDGRFTIGRFRSRRPVEVWAWSGQGEKMFSSMDTSPDLRRGAGVPVIPGGRPVTIFLRRHGVVRLTDYPHQFEWPRGCRVRFSSTRGVYEAPIRRVRFGASMPEGVYRMDLIPGPATPAIWTRTLRLRHGRPTTVSIFEFVNQLSGGRLILHTRPMTTRELTSSSFSLNRLLRSETPTIRICEWRPGCAPDPNETRAK